MSERNKQIALKFVEAMGSNDPEGAASVLAPDGVAVTKGRSRFAGTRSAEVIVGAIESFKTVFPTGLRLEIGTVLAEGDKVVIEAEGNAVTFEGKPYRNQYCFVATLRDGKITQFNEYLCSALAEEVLGPVAKQLGAP